MFGIELRNTNKPLSVKQLYDEVDRTLYNLGIEPNTGEVSADVAVQTVAHKLTDMFQPNKHFSVCTIRHLSELTSVVISSKRMNIYQSIHCMNWGSMTDEYRKSILAMVLDDFRSVLQYNLDQDE